MRFFLQWAGLPVVTFVLMAISTMPSRVAGGLITAQPPTSTAAATEPPPSTKILDPYDDWRKMAVVILTTVAGSYICLMLKIEHDIKWARQATFYRRVSFAAISFTWGVCSSPYFAIQFNQETPKYILAIVSVVNAILAWFTLEILWTKGPALVQWFTSRFFGKTPLVEPQQLVVTEPHGAVVETGGSGNVGPASTVNDPSKN